MAKPSRFERSRRATLGWRSAQRAEDQRKRTEFRHCPNCGAFLKRTGRCTKCS